MGILRLGACVTGVYSAFLLWGIAQEKLSSSFPLSHPAPHHSGSSQDLGDKFPSPLFINYAQSLASALSALVYLVVGAWSDGSLKRRGLKEVLGLSALSRTIKPLNSNGIHANGYSNGKSLTNGNSNGHEKGDKSDGSAVVKVASKKRSLWSLLVQVSVLQTMAGPIGFLALRHISFPTMVLGKSCKLIPVLILNVLIYRRRFSAHKYVVVSLVTIGISMFMLFAKNSKKKGGSDSVWGLSLLGINLLIDGLTNSTQDEIFVLYPEYTGQQLMFGMSLISQALLLPALLLPIPLHPLSLLPPVLTGAEHRSHVTFSSPAILDTMRFLKSHPTAVAPLLAYAILGGMGQLFIFETIKSFGSLVLTMITVTRKLFTMLLSVVVFEHRLTFGQWAGVVVVFSGIGVEAGMKRFEMMRKARR